MMNIKRRDFLAGASGVLAASAVAAADKAAVADSGAHHAAAHEFNGSYRGTKLEQIAFPMGGMGAGMICLEGTGALSKFSLRHRPELASQPVAFAAIALKGSRTMARVLEGPVPDWKLQPHFFEWDMLRAPAAMTWGMPRFRDAVFEARFPFATVRLEDDAMPLAAEVTGWSPFSPGDADNASLPVAALEYQFTNRSASFVDAVFSFNAQNFMVQPHNRMVADPKSPDRIRPTQRGFILATPGTEDRPWDEGYCAVWVDEAGAQVNHSWFTGSLGLIDGIPMVWDAIASGKLESRAPRLDAPSLGASIFVPFALAAGQIRTIKLCLAWYVPKSNLFSPSYIKKDGEWVPIATPAQTYSPWYAGRFADIEGIKSYWESHHASLEQASRKFSRALHDSTLPSEVTEAVTANLTILKSPTVLRQTDGRLWSWEGSGDENGAGGPGSCTHVWNYAQALPHLFPALERGLRETEFGADQGEDGFQLHRAALPIRQMGDTPEGRAMPAAADGQLGGIIKAYRDWRISGDTAWLRGLWPKIRSSLDYCIASWDPKHRGWIEEPHLTTYDVKLWGPEGLCTSLYLGALKAATRMGSALGDTVEGYSRLLRQGIQRMEAELFNGEYFFQKTEWKSLRASFPLPSEYITDRYTPEGLELAKQEGPAYQYGIGCLSDGVLGVWLCLVAGMDNVLDPRKVDSHLGAVYRHNFKKNLTDYPQLGRPNLGMGPAGLLVCTWPRGGRTTIPLLYVDEVWTGVEYQVAAHLIMWGKVEQGLEIVRAARSRYDGRVRNPFAEQEAGQWYARAMSSYSLLQACSGARYDAVEKTLYLKPALKGDFRCFLSTATGYGTVGVREGQPFVDVVHGTIPVTKIQYSAA
jgi:uncharacterized protein (DUF608 family)